MLFSCPPTVGPIVSEPQTKTRLYTTNIGQTVTDQDSFTHNQHRPDRHRPIHVYTQLTSAKPSQTDTRLYTTNIGQTVTDRETRLYTTNIGSTVTDQDRFIPFTLRRFSLQQQKSAQPSQTETRAYLSHRDTSISSTAQVGPTVTAKTRSQLSSTTEVGQAVINRDTYISFTAKVGQLPQTGDTKNNYLSQLKSAQPSQSETRVRL